MSRERAQALLCSNFGHFGPLQFPYVKMGRIDSLDLFGPTELMLLALYWHNRKRWRTVLDIGANLGLHSICMAKCGFDVQAYEPDPQHYKRLCDNLLANKALEHVTPLQKAVHVESGHYSFVRVLDNLTGNHLMGFKDSYGPRETITVETADCRKLWPRADFAKLDCEGNEAVLIKTLTAADMQHLDLVLEVRNQDNANTIFWHFRDLGVPMWSQKIDWRRVEKVEDVPRLNREGSLFVGHRGPWE
jgi:FkbM family methyltransferase